MKVSIHRISIGNLQTAIRHLKLKNFKTVFEKRINNFNHLFMLSSPEPVMPTWLKECMYFIENSHLSKDEKEQIKSFKTTNLAGVLFVYNLTYAYCITFGSVFLILKTFFDYEFSLSLAERLVNPNLIKHKGSKYITSKKDQVLTSYKNSTEIEFDIGESFNILKGELSRSTEKYGKLATFGNSFQINPNITLENISDLIKEIELDLKKNADFQIPRISKEKDKTIIENLNKELYGVLRDSNVNQHKIYFNEYAALEGNSFTSVDIFNKYAYVRKYRKSKKIIEELTLNGLEKYLQSESIDKNTIDILNDIVIHFEPENDPQNSITKKLLKIVSYISKKNQHIFQNGEWWIFNHEYIKKLNGYLDKISICEGEIKSIPKNITEDALSIDLTDKHGYTLLDKKNLCTLPLKL